jgi:endonuclease/exonuclease/phosphatase family metal-dependent hydrolase
VQTLRVVTLNIWNRGGPWDDRLTAIRAELAELAPDVIGLQEVLRAKIGDDPDQAKQIAEGLGYHVAYGASFDTGGIEFGNAVLTKFPIRHSQVFPLPSIDTPDARCLLHAEIDAPFGTLHFFVTHLSWRFNEGSAREAQVKAVAKHVKELCPINQFPPVLVGDFNAAPDADEIRYLKGLCSLGARSVYFADTFGMVGRGDGVTFTARNPFATDLREPDRRIDYIFVRGPDPSGRGEPLDARVCFDRPRRGVYASDHFGVSATIRVET